MFHVKRCCQSPSRVPRSCGRLSFRPPPTARNFTGDHCHSEPVDHACSPDRPHDHPLDVALSPRLPVSKRTSVKPRTESLTSSARRGSRPLIAASSESLSHPLASHSARLASIRTSTMTLRFIKVSPLRKESLCLTDASSGHQHERPSRPEGARTTADRYPIHLMTSDSRREGPGPMPSRDLPNPFDRARVAPPDHYFPNLPRIALSVSPYLALSLSAKGHPAAASPAGKDSLTNMTIGMDLSSAPLDTTLTFVVIDGTVGQRRRLATLGLREGASFRLLTRPIGGGRILLVGGSRIALSRELVRQLRAEAA
jgi:Fe2+ transport system protein FeoA